MHSDYDRNDKTNILIASIGGWLVINRWYTSDYNRYNMVSAIEV